MCRTTREHVQQSRRRRVIARSEGEALRLPDNDMRRASGTISEQILSRNCGRDVRAGDIVVCDVDRVVGTDGSGPMAIDYFEQMGGDALFDPSRVFFSLDHYAPPDTPATRAFHARIREFADRHGATVFDVGEGISHQIVVERGPRRRPATCSSAPTATR